MVDKSRKTKGITRKKTYNKRGTMKKGKNTKHKGGKFLGKGTFGAVYSEPRLLCKNEKIEDIMGNNEASKIFNAKGEAMKDKKIYMKLKKYLGSDINELIKYAIIPYKVCELNKKSLKQPPYNKTGWYGNNPIVGNYLTDKISISKVGGLSLYDINSMIQNNIDNNIPNGIIEKYIKNLINVGYGVKLLMKHKLTHSDIKTLNTILDRDNLGGDITPYIIDVGDIDKIDKIKNNTYLYGPLLYPYRPPTIIYTLFNDSTAKLYDGYKIRINNELLLKIFNTYSNFNMNVSTFIDRIFNTSIYNQFDNFNGTKNGILVVKLMSLLHGQKYYNTIVEFTPDNNVKLKPFSSDKSYFDYFMISLKNKTPNPTLTYFESIFNSYYKKEKIIHNIYQRIDLYSFGIIIIEGITAYLISLYRESEKKRQFNICKRTEKLIMRLLIIAYLCCYINPHENPDMSSYITDILELYEKTIHGEKISSNIQFYNPNTKNTVSENITI